MSYQVKTEVFEGPFDLLLHLISKRELDIYEVSLAAITEEYVAHLRAMQELDLEVATEFLVVAATLVELKASRLLPGPPAEDDDLGISDRDVLIARLLEYKAFKDAAAMLAERIEANAGYAGRSAGPGEEFRHVLPDVLAKITPQRLAELAVTALTPKQIPRLDLSHITPIRVSVGQAAMEMAERLRAAKTETFRVLTGDARSRIDLVVRFLALLELIKRGFADVAQSATFGEIQATWIAGDDVSIEGLETEDEW